MAQEINMAGNLVIATVDCGVTERCGNNRCFWRQRNQMGRGPWYILDPKLREAQDTLHKAIEAEHGSPIFPKMHIGVGTNCMNVSCDGYVEPVKK